MTTQELKDLAARHGLKIDGFHAGAGKFRDVYIGTGANYNDQRTLMSELRARNVGCKLSTVNVPEHPAYGKFFVEVTSFWWVETEQPADQHGPIEAEH
jgi:hypothetical protein